ncbi:MAG TPA: hypothetical protein VF820_00370 [Patescibacteria group bacterium]
MKKISLLLLLIPLLFYKFFTFQTIVGGDWHYVFKSTSDSFPLIPAIYRSYVEIGQNTSALAGVEMYFQFTSKVFMQILPWSVVERIFWFFPFLIFSLISSYLFTRSVIGSLIYTTNTYILMILGGGQMGVVMAYSLVPFVFSFSKILFSDNFQKIKNSKLVMQGILLAVSAGVVLFFDLRIFYLTSLILLLCLVFSFIKSEFSLNILKKRVIFFVSSGILSILINGVWIVGLITSRQSATLGFGEEITSPKIISFLSFANFSDTFGLLHPNWPENIFGKVYFMRPEFLLLPIFAFGAIFFINKVKSETRRSILFYSIIGLLGVFLAKGENSPFGSIYGWLFTHIPGFIMFRDPTKFYVFIALAYSFLIPVTIAKFTEFIKTTHFKLIAKIIPIILVLFWLVLIRQLWLGKLGGIFIAKKVPAVYTNLDTFIASQPEFYRTLWVPNIDIFGSYSNSHPFINAQDVFKTNDPVKLAQILQKIKTPESLKREDIKYIVVPLDSEKIFFVKNRKYDNVQREKTIQLLDKISWLKKMQLKNLGNIAVYQIQNTNGHFWVEDIKGNQLSVSTSWKCSSPTSCVIYFQNAPDKFNLIFSERFDPQWYIQNGTIFTHSQKTFDNLNEFTIAQKGNGAVKLSYTPQKMLRIGWIITFVSVIGSFGIIFILHKKVSSN